MKRLLGLTLVVAFVVLCLPAARAEEGPTEAQIKQWVEDLGSAEFPKRREAHDALVKAGKRSIEALKASAKSEDPQIRSSVADLLSQLRWAGIAPSINYVRCFPGECLVMAQVPHGRKSLESARATAVGKLLEGPQFEVLRAMIMEKMGAGDHKAVTDEVTKWLNRFDGQVAGAVWDLNLANLLNPSSMGLAAIAELPEADAEAIFKELLALSPTYKESERNGLKLWSADGGLGCMALVGRHFIIGMNAKSVLSVAEGLIDAVPGNLDSNEDLKLARPKLGADPDFLLVFNFQRYMELVRMIGAMGGGGELGQAEKQMKLMGYSGMRTLLWSTSIDGAGFEDRLIMAFDPKEPPAGLLKVMGSAPDKSNAESLAFVPADAESLYSLNVDGPGLQAAFQEFLAGGGEADPELGVKINEFKAGLAQIETMLNVKLGDVAGWIKGSGVAWAKLSKDLTPPELGLVVPCADEAKAKLMSEFLVKAFNAAVEGGKALKQTELNGRTIFSEAEDSPLVKTPERAQIPYRAAWCVQGRFLIVSSGLEALKARLAALDAKTAGFDIVKLGANPDKLANAIYLDVAALAEYGRRFGLPQLVKLAHGAPPEATKLLEGLAGQEKIFAGLPPLVMRTEPLNGTLSITSLRTPLPYLATVVGAVVAAFVFEAPRAPRGGRPMPPPAPIHGKDEKPAPAQTPDPEPEQPKEKF